jgi:hypothetical protein
VLSSDRSLWLLAWAWAWLDNQLILVVVRTAIVQCSKRLLALQPVSSWLGIGVQHFWTLQLEQSVFAPHSVMQIVFRFLLRHTGKSFKKKMQ